MSDIDAATEQASTAPQRHSRLTLTGKAFTAVAVLEAITWAGLLVGIILKYVTQTTEIGVALFGPLHGAMFLIYLAVTIVAAIVLRWPWWVAMLALLAAVPPLMTVPLEVILRRRGLLPPRTRITPVNSRLTDQGTSS